MKEPIAININFDSINQNLGFDKNFRYPSYFHVFDRFINFSNKYNFKYSIYIIGKDLENPEIKARVKDWYLMGHEIGNHTYTHPMNMGALTKEKVRYEILKSHEMINKSIGVEPQGFISPGWNSSQKIIEVLIEQNYLYDTSLFNSALTLPIVLKNALNHYKKPRKIFEIINRRDYFYFLNKPKSPFFVDSNYKPLERRTKNSILMLPLPTLNKFNIPYWHTLNFFISSTYSKKLTIKYLENYHYFYYLLHPADLIGPKDNIDENHTIERMNISLKEKKEIMNNFFVNLEYVKRPIITMKELALNFIKKSNQ